MEKYARKVIGILFSVIILSIFFEVFVFKQVDKTNAYKVNSVLLNQVIDLIQTNRRNSEEFYASVKEDYKVRAQSVSYILDSKPSAVFDVDELKKIASLLSIDEINIFDETGKIYSGSVPKYYGLSFDSGEQMGYFKPMLSDKSLSMCQDVTPNTSDGKSMMYAITWNESADKMIQIGIEPFRLLEIMKRNQVSVILNEMPVYNGTNVFIADTVTDQILASNLFEIENSNLKDIGFDAPLDGIIGVKNRVLKIGKEDKYCTYVKNGDYLLCVASSTKSNRNIFSVMLSMFADYLSNASLYISKIIISKFKSEEEKLSQYKILSAMSKIYSSMYLVDLKKNIIEEFSTQNGDKFLKKVEVPSLEFISNLIETRVSNEYKESFAAFTDLNTVQKRMAGKQIISAEFLSLHYHWYRANFISIEYDKNNELEKTILVIRNVNEEKNKEATLVKRSTTDELTGLLNRRAYEDDLKKLTPDMDFVYITFDLNGLKNANDTIGHEAGDELIVAAADFMGSQFDFYGKIYRTGGDEFAMILNKNTAEISKEMELFKKNVSFWEGKLVQSMAISCGMVSSKEKKWNTVHDIIKEADKRMYLDKENFYKKSGIDRRAFQKTYTALGSLYVKILKINLTKDNYKIVKVNKDEQTEERGFDNSISRWLNNFAYSNQVHRDDLDNYIKKTDLNYMRKFFKNGNKILSVVYRRKIGDSFKNVLMEIIPSDDYSDNEQNCYLYVKNISGDEVLS